MLPFAPRSSPCWASVLLGRRLLPLSSSACRSLPHVASWSSKRWISTNLASAFNRVNPADKSGPEATGLFGIDLLANAEGFHELRDESIRNCQALVQEATSNDRKRKMVQIFDDLSNNLCKVADLAEFIRVAHPFTSFKKAAEEASLSISVEVERCNTNKKLYDSLAKVVNGDDIVPTDEVDKHVAKLFLDDFEQNVVHLDDEKRNTALKLHEDILNAGAFFAANCGKPRSFEISEMPEQLRPYFRQDRGHIYIDSLYPNSDNEFVREAAYRLFLSFDAKQDQLLTILLQSRLALAQLCGFKSFAKRSISNGIIRSPEEVVNFLSTLSNKVRPFADKDYDAMLQIKKVANPNSEQLMPWDVAYYNALFKEDRFHSLLSASLPYFSLGACMEGLGLLFNRLFDLELTVVPTRPGEIWNNDILKLEVADKSGDLLGHIYCDFFERKNKPHQDCHFTIRGGCRLPDGSYQNPIVVLMLNFPPAMYNKPSLLNPHMVENLFHEMGHAIHSMLALTPYQHVTGTRCSTDLAEVPSVLMESFCTDRQVISSFAKHYKTGAVIPQDILDAWIESKRIFNAADMQTQLFYAMLDQVYHSDNPFMDHDTTYVLREVQNQYYGLPYVSNTTWQLRFAHLVGYGAKYYSYLVSRSVSGMIWDRLFKGNPFCEKAGTFYRQEVLSHGGGKPPVDIVQSVLSDKKATDPSSLAESLTKNLVENYDL